MRSPVKEIRRRLPVPIFLGALLSILFLPTACSESPQGGPEVSEVQAVTEGPGLYRAPAIPNDVDGVTWEAGNWEPHLAAGEEGVSWGNHRAVVVVDEAIQTLATGTPGEGAGESRVGSISPLEAVMVTIPWRRRDTDPGAKGVIVVDATSGEGVPNVLVTRIENASGVVIFQPNPGSLQYHVYYLPWQSTGGYYPTITYPTQAELRAGSSTTTGGGETASRAQEASQGEFSWGGRAPNPDPTWEERILATPTSELPRGRATHIQSVDEFHSFFPMEVIATPPEEAAFMAATGGEEGWALVPEHRDYPVRMTGFIPRHWIDRLDAAPDLSTPVDPEEPTPSGTPPERTPAFDSFSSQVLRGESFTYQLAVVSGDAPLNELRVDFDGFPRDWLDAMTCFNCGGTDEKGAAFTKELHVPSETVQPLWIGLDIPEDQRPGSVEGTVTVTSHDRGSRTVSIALEVQDGNAPSGGENEPDLQTRLAWLNSTGGTDPDFIIEPFEPVSVGGPTGNGGPTLSILGRRIELGEYGLPDQIFSYFTPELTGFAEEPEPILARPLALEVVTAFDEVLEFSPASYAVQQDSRGRVEWTVENTSERFNMTVEGTLEYDGMLDYGITLVALEDMALNDIALPVSLVPDAAEYMLGLGRKGGKRPAQIDWKWAVENHQEGVWLGGIHKGLQYVLRDDNYVRPLNTNFYQNQPLNMPPSWFNRGRGGIRIFEEEAGAGDPAFGNRRGAEPWTGPESAPEAQGAPSDSTPAAVTAYNYSGTRTVLAGDTLHFNVRFLLTPFKPIDTSAHFNTRFVHQYVPVDSVRAWGGTVVNIHHANEINPYINYPFFSLDQQADYIDEAHEKGIKVKLYNTIRELTYKAYELFPMRSLGDEILNDGEGGGHSWMQEHLEGDYHSAWHASRTDDAAMLNKGTSRWTNYYIEGINWLAVNQNIDGLYLDDIAFSRETVKRLVTVLDKNRPEVVIDLHSANQFNVRDGFTNSAMLYMEHFPFISRLWFGEYFEYDLDEDYWMTEVSGLPFGLMGEMLQDGGHPYRGMLYGMTARKYGNVDPRPVWAMMNDFGIAESEMKGYWLEGTPVTTDHPRVLATTYVRPEAILVALASWSEEDEVVSLSVDWTGLGFGNGSGNSGDSVVGGSVGLDTSSIQSGDAQRPDLVRTYAPPVEGLQEGAEIDLTAVRVPAGQGLFVVVERGPNHP